MCKLASELKLCEKWGLVKMLSLLFSVVFLFLIICRRCLQWFELVKLCVPTTTLVKALTYSSLNYESKNMVFKDGCGIKEFISVL